MRPTLGAVLLALSLTTILAPTLAAAPAAPESAADEFASPERAVTVMGTITKLAPAEHTIAVSTADGADASFRWNAETKINGVLAPGARVTIRYSMDANGSKLALQITVAKS